MTWRSAAGRNAIIFREGRSQYGSANARCQLGAPSIIFGKTLMGSCLISWTHSNPVGARCDGVPIHGSLIFDPDQYVPLIILEQQYVPSMVAG